VIKQAPKTVITATGMLFDKSKKTVTLYKRVKAHYEKPAAKRSVTQKMAKPIPKLTSKLPLATSSKKNVRSPS
jgi:lipopolysaccharide export system protein LptC